MFFEVISEMETGIEFRKANRDSLREYRSMKTRPILSWEDKHS